MKIWFDKHNPAPKGYLWARDTNQAIQLIIDEEEYRRVSYLPTENAIEAISIVECDGFGDELIEWMNETGRNYAITAHANINAIDCYKRHQTPDEANLADLQELCRIEGNEWCLVIRK